MKESRGMFTRWVVYYLPLISKLSISPEKLTGQLTRSPESCYPSQPRDPDEPNSFLVNPNIEDVYGIENSKVEWTLEYKKDLTLSQVMEFVKGGITLLIYRGEVYLRELTRCSGGLSICT